MNYWRYHGLYLRNRLPVIILFFVANSIGLKVAAQTEFFQHAEFISGTDTLHYRILYPSDYDEKKKYPLVLFLHGAGERGHDNNAQLLHGAQLFIDSGKAYPAIVIFPQCPENDYWARVLRDTSDTGLISGDFVFGDLNAAPAGKALSLTTELILSMVESNIIDTKRIYALGLSMGGMGVYELLWRVPDMFTAAVIICGAGNLSMISRMREGLPVWIFHGDKDDIVPVTWSRNMAEAMQKENLHVQYTEYPDVNHNSWDRAFAEPGLLTWLFAQSK